MPSIVVIRVGDAASSSYNALLQYAPASVTAVAAIIGIIVQVVVARRSLSAQREFEVRKARQQALMAFYNPLDICLMQLEAMLGKSNFRITSYDPAQPLQARAMRGIAGCCKSIKQIYSSQTTSFMPLEGVSMDDLMKLQTWCTCVTKLDDGNELSFGVDAFDLEPLELVKRIHESIERERAWLNGQR